MDDIIVPPMLRERGDVPMSILLIIFIELKPLSNKLCFYVTLDAADHHGVSPIQLKMKQVCVVEKPFRHWPM